MKVLVDDEMELSSEKKQKIETLGELLLTHFQPNVCSKIKDKTWIKEVKISEDKVSYDIKCSLSRALVFYRIASLFGDEMLKGKYTNRNCKFTETGFIFSVSFD